MSIRTNILLRVYLAFGLILLFAAAVVLQLCRVQFIQGAKWKSKSMALSTRYFDVEATKGNIFAADGSLLATSVPEYELRMDMRAASDKLFNEKVDSLALCLARYNGDKSAREYERMLRQARDDSSRYQLIKKKASFEDLREMLKFPLFN